MEQRPEQINMNEFLFLTRLVDNCIDSFLSGVSPKDCCKQMNDLASEYKHNLPELKVLQLTVKAQELFVNYFEFFKEYGEITSNKNKYSVNDVCLQYIALRNKIILANSNMLSKRYLELEKNIIRQLQDIGKRVNINEETNNKTK